jgi:hypothetical protein
MSSANPNNFPLLRSGGGEPGLPMRNAGCLRSLVQCMREQYQKAVEACLEWQDMANQIEVRYADGTRDGELRVRQAMIESIAIRDATDKRNFHLAMHQLLSDQVMAETMYSRFETGGPKNG